MRHLKSRHITEYPNEYWTYAFDDSKGPVIMITTKGYKQGIYQNTSWRSLEEAMDYNINKLGAVEIFLKPCCGKSPTIWKDNAWHCPHCGSSDYGKVVEYADQLELDLKEGLSKNSPKVCECGADKVYGSGTGHSSWCPKGG